MPLVADSHQVVEGHPLEGKLWPVLYQHCARTRSCDPMTRFNEGAGQASGLEGPATWFAESVAAMAPESAAFGPRILVSFQGPAEWGGPGGRPLTKYETPANLRAPIARQTWLTLEYRLPDGAPVLYYVHLRTAQLLVAMPPGPEDETREDLKLRTSSEIASWRWPGGAQGARIDLSGADGARLLEGYSFGFSANAHLEDEDWRTLGAEPWFLDLTLAVSPDASEANELLAAIDRGDTLRLKASAPAGALLTDRIKTGSLSAALDAARAALSDPVIAQPLTERCLGVLDVAMSDWDLIDLSPAVRSCDPRTQDQRRLVPGYAPR